MTKINLKKDEINYLNAFVKKGNRSARALTRARILLLSNNKDSDTAISNMLSLGRTTVWRVKNNYLHKGVEYALTERERPGQPLKYDIQKKSEIIAYACTNPPEGRKRWTVRLLAEELSKKSQFKTINRETVRIILKKATPNLG